MSGVLSEFFVAKYQTISECFLPTNRVRRESLHLPKKGVLVNLRLRTRICWVFHERTVELELFNEKSTKIWHANLSVWKDVTHSWLRRTIFGNWNVSGNFFLFAWGPSCLWGIPNGVLLAHPLTPCGISGQVSVNASVVCFLSRASVF